MKVRTYGKIDHFSVNRARYLDHMRSWFWLVFAMDQTGGHSIDEPDSRTDSVRLG